MTTYQLTGEGYVIRDGDTKVPIVDTTDFPNTNLDYLAYKQWIAEGNTPEPYIAPPTPIPASVTMRQARLALLNAGLLPGITAAISALQSPQKEAAQIEWEYSQAVERHRGLVLLLGGTLGLSSAQLDALFVTAAGL